MSHSVSTARLLFTLLAMGCSDVDSGSAAPAFQVPAHCLEHVAGGGFDVDPTRLAHIGTRKQLFIDDWMVAHTEGLKRQLGSATKENGAQPVIVADQSWEHPTRIGFYTSVAWNAAEDRFEMWYLAQMPGHRDMNDIEADATAVAFATSTDGIHWQKGGIMHGGHGFNAMIDPTVPWGHAEKFKAAFDDETDFEADEEITEAHIAHSADGLTWQSYNDGRSVIGRAADTANQILWDGAQYLMVTRQDLNGDVEEGEARGTRVIRRAADQDVLDNPTGWDDAGGSIIAYTCTAGSEEWVDRQIHATLVHPYEELYLGFVHTMQGNLDDTDYRDGPAFVDTRPESNVMELYLAPSRSPFTDGWDLAWAYGMEPLIQRGPAGAWDQGGIHSVNLITKDDRHWLFYNGSIERFGHGDSRAHMGIGLATLRLDGFVALAGDGTVTTRPFTAEGTSLEVNVIARAITIELLDDTGVIASTSARELDELRWRPDLALTIGEKVSLRFTLVSGALYAFRVTGD